MHPFGQHFLPLSQSSSKRHDGTLSDRGHSLCFALLDSRGHTLGFLIVGDAGAVKKDRTIRYKDFLLA